MTTGYNQPPDYMRQLVSEHLEAIVIIKEIRREHADFTCLEGYQRDWILYRAIRTLRDSIEVFESILDESI